MDCELTLHHVQVLIPIQPKYATRLLMGESDFFLADQLTPRRSQMLFAFRVTELGMLDSSSNRSMLLPTRASRPIFSAISVQTTIGHI
jgi:hypothetical protein